MAVNNSLAPTKKQSFAAAMQTEGYQKLVNGTLRDPQRANRFVAAVTAAVTANPLLQQCEPKTILSAAFQGEALELSPSPTLGEYYLVPYKKNIKAADGSWESTYIANFQIGTAGRIQLAMRSGQYKDLGAIEIREGEYLGRNPENGKPMFKFVTDDDIRESLPIIGYLGYFELTNGFTHSVYFSKEKCLKWAERYSKSFDRKLYDKVQKGEKLDWKEEAAASTPWIAHTDAMSKNLVLRQVLKMGPKSIEMRGLVEGDDRTDADIASVVTAPAVEEKATDDFFAGTENEAAAEIVQEEKTVETKPVKKSKKSPEAQQPFFEGADGAGENG